MDPLVLIIGVISPRTLIPVALVYTTAVEPAGLFRIELGQIGSYRRSRGVPKNSLSRDPRRSARLGRTGSSGPRAVPTASLVHLLHTPIFRTVRCERRGRNRRNLPYGGCPYRARTTRACGVSGCRGTRGGRRCRRLGNETEWQRASRGIRSRARSGLGWCERLGLIRIRTLAFSRRHIVWFRVSSTGR